MAFGILFQTNSSEKNKLNKSLTTNLNLTGELIEDSSIIDPVITIKAELGTLSTCNYMTIDTFGRSYFITNIESINNEFVRVSGHVDVLSTYKKEIRRNSAIIKRQQNQWNLYLNDGSLKVYQNPEVQTISFGSGFNTMEFVMAVAGG